MTPSLFAQSNEETKFICRLHPSAAYNFCQFPPPFDTAIIAIRHQYLRTITCGTVFSTINQIKSNLWCIAFNKVSICNAFIISLFLISLFASRHDYMLWLNLYLFLCLGYSDNPPYVRSCLLFTIETSIFHAIEILSLFFHSSTNQTLTHVCILLCAAKIALRS